MYTDLIHPAVEYEDNSDSKVLNVFLVETLDGINNYIFKVPGKWLLSSQLTNEISFRLKRDTGEKITSGYPIFLDLRIGDAH